MKECTSFKEYKGILPPKCNGGKGCEACWKKYNDERYKDRWKGSFYSFRHQFIHSGY